MKEKYSQVLRTVTMDVCKAVCAAADGGFLHYGCALACAERGEKRRGQLLRRRESQERERRRLKNKQR
eukprot:5727275-Karenia_brevis.AAC.1